MGMGRLLKFGFCSKKHDTIGILKPKPSKGLYFLPTIAWTRTLNGKDIKVIWVKSCDLGQVVVILWSQMRSELTPCFVSIS